MLTESEPTPFITTLPLTAEAREHVLQQLFADEMPHHGELFIPGSAFYTHGPPQVRAEQMLKKLCQWLGIKPGYIGLEFESSRSATTQEQRHTIFIESQVAMDELLLGTTLAHALVRYLLEERKQIHLADPYDQISLTVTGVIIFGLGVVSANGLRPTRAYRQKRQELLGNIPLKEYCNMLHGFLWHKNIPALSYEASLAPWTAKSLNAHLAKRPIPIVRQQYHLQRQKRYEKIGLIWVGLLVIFIGGFVAMQRVKTYSSADQALREKVVLLQQLKQLCNDSVAYTKQYADMTDIQALRSVNAEELRCASLGSELLNAQKAYEKAL